MIFPLIVRSGYPSVVMLLMLETIFDIIKVPVLQGDLEGEDNKITICSSLMMLTYPLFNAIFLRFS